MKKITKNPCSNCLVRSICITNCDRLWSFGKFMRSKNGGKPLGIDKWVLEQEKRTRIIEEYNSGGYYFNV